jgi:DNA invertase Pin-like site-specific DNA recombinase
MGERAGINVQNPMLASLAKQERIRIQERVPAGLERAKVKGTKSGRAIGRPRTVFDRERARPLRRDGKSWGAIAHELGKNVTAIRRASREDPVAPPAMSKPSEGLSHGL